MSWLADWLPWILGFAVVEIALAAAVGRFLSLSHRHPESLSPVTERRPARPLEEGDNRPRMKAVHTT